MDLVSKSYGSTSPMMSPSSTTDTAASFPIIAVALLGILATAFLLVNYYIFVIKCCLNRRGIDLLRRFSTSRNRNNQDSMMAYNQTLMQTNRGLEEAVIRLIPIFKYTKEANCLKGDHVIECAVCLNEFEENEKLRRIPNCGHVFHIDCIDIWLQGNANCPLCRTSISLTNTTRSTFGIVAPSSSPQDPSPYSESLIGGDEDYVVIEFNHINNRNPSPTMSRDQSRTPNSTQEGSGSSRKFNKITTSMADECIDIVRCKDDQFVTQPIRRSFSMDSCMDRNLLLAVREIVQQKQRGLSDTNEVISSPTERCSTSSGNSNNRPRRNFFSFGNGRGSKNATLPVYLDP